MRSTEKAIYLKSGLRSGQRDTDMVNTMLNRVQFQTVTQDLDQIIGKEYGTDSIEVQLHKGDDVAAFLQTWVSALAFNIALRAGGQNG